jgi:hypothetical protein
MVWLVAIVLAPLLFMIVAVWAVVQLAELLLVLCLVPLRLLLRAAPLERVKPALRPLLQPVEFDAARREGVSLAQTT